MATSLRDIRILGVHPVQPSADEFAEALEILFGSELSGEELEAATQGVRDHFNQLFLIEIQILPPDAEFDWGELTQPEDAQPPSNWQVAYDERPCDRATSSWTFFLHHTNLQKPIATPLGLRTLPEQTPLPTRLANIKYEVP